MPSDLLNLMRRNPPYDKKQRWPELAGRIEGAAHVLPIRVYYEDTDFSGFVYHANYLKFCERGRSDFVRLLGLEHRALHSGAVPAAFVVRRMEIDFLKPARIDEVLEVVTTCAELGAAALNLDQRVIRDGVLLMRAGVQVVLVGRDGKPRRLGGMIRAAFERFVNQDR